MSLLKRLLKRMMSPQQRAGLKRLKRHLVTFIKRPHKTSIAELENILRYDLGITVGDRVFISSSFGLLNALDYSPHDVIVLLQQIVSDKGNIMMPYYPPINAAECMNEQYCFDMERTVSGMGILTNEFSKMPDVVKSIHPIKSVCVWGRDAQKIANGHQKSKTPYYWDSPYGKMLQMGCKSIGLGVPNMPMGHALEDVLSENIYEYYLPRKYNFRVRLADGTIQHIESLVPKPDMTRFFFFFWEIICNESIKKVPFGGGFIYIVNHDEKMMQSMKDSLGKGITAYNCK